MAVTEASAVFSPFSPCSSDRIRIPFSSASLLDLPNALLFSPATPVHMKKLLLSSLLALAAFAPTALHAQSAAAANGSWHPNSLLQAVGYMLLFAFIGILVAIVGYRIFDLCTPGDLHKEIVENKNVAASIIGGAIILGVCIIVAAAMLG